MKNLGFTFHVGHGQGHESTFNNRVGMEKDDGCLISYESGIFHYGPMGNMDSQIGDMVLRDHGYWNGIFLCFCCGKRRLRTEKEATRGYSNAEEMEVWDRGYYICDECKKENRKLGQFKMGEHWQPFMLW